MNEPLINPLIFYLIDLISNIREIACVCSGLSGIIFVATYIVKLDNEHDLGYYEELGKTSAANAIKLKIERNNAHLKILSMVLFSMMTFAVILPSNQTMYKMLAAQYITKHNINESVDFVVETINKAAEKLIKQTETKKENNR